jgi:hypothetical protein
MKNRKNGRSVGGWLASENEVLCSFPALIAGAEVEISPSDTETLLRSTRV